MTADPLFLKVGDLEPTPAQRRAIDCPVGDVVVTAGPGSGKTRVLVGRMEALIGAGVPAERIAAITFTRRAAAEMKERLRATLIKRWRDAATASDMEEARLWRSAIWRIESAYIGTIHGFCRSILRDYPHMAGLDPEFAVLDPHRSGLLLGEIVDDVLEEALALWEYEHLGEMVDYRSNRRENTTKDLLQRIRNAAMRLPLDWQGIRRKTEDTLHQRYRDAGGSEFTWANGGLEPEDPAAIEAAVEHFLSVYREKSTRSKKYPPLVERFLGEWPTLKQRLKGGEGERVLARIRDLLPLKECPKPYQPAIEGIHGLGVRMDLRLEWETAQEILAVLGEIENRFEAAKASMNALDYDDFQRIALNALECQPDLLARLRRRYTHVLVDEFQDTDTVQWRIVQLLRGDGKAPSRDAGGVFVVGDADQSIYRFRGAEVEVFRAAGDRLEADGARRVHLDTNFRSTPTLVALTNTVFGQWFDEYRPLAPGPEKSADVDPPVELLVVARPKKNKDAAEFRRRQAEVIAGRIEECLASGSRPGDLAILSRSKNPLLDCARALASRGIPHRVVGGRDLFASTEIGDLKALLRWLSDPADDIALATLLRSPFFSVDDDTLLSLAEEGMPRLWDALQSAACAGKPRLDRCQKILSTWRDWRDVLSPADLMTAALDATGYREIVSLHPWGDQVLANLDRAITLARQLEDVQATGTAELARYLDVLKETGAREEADARLPGEHEVILSTIHGAKGLEFDTVFIPDANFSRSTNLPDYFLDADRGLTVKSARGGAGPLFSRRGEEEKILGVAEEGRIFYVGCTRAERRLILVGGGHEASPCDPEELPDPDYFPSTSYFRWYCEALEDNGCLPLRVYHVPLDALSDETAATANLRSGHPSTADILQTAEGWMEDDVAAGVLAGESRERVVYAVTSLVDYRQCPRLYALRHRLGWVAPPPDIRQDRSGDDVASQTPLDPMVFGSLVHRACELLIDHGPAGAVSVALREASLSETTAFILPARKRMLQLVERFRESPVFSDFEAAYRMGEARSEWAFQQSIPGLPDRYISGKIDAIYRTEGGGWHIVDYKSDRIGSDQVAERAQSYAFQLQLYAWVVRNNLGCVGSVYLYFLQPAATHVVKSKACGEDAVEQAATIIDAIERASSIDDFPRNRSDYCRWCDFQFHCDTASSPGTGIVRP